MESKNLDKRAGYAQTYNFISFPSFIFLYHSSLKLTITRFLLENITRDKPNVAQYYLGFMDEIDAPQFATNPSFNAILNSLQGVYLFSFPSLAIITWYQIQILS
jgi:hypothetical protein